MKGLLIYQSKWGDSRQVGEAIAKGLTDAGHEVTVLRVQDAGTPDPGVDFVVLGGPTRAARAYGPIKRLAGGKLKQGWAGKPFATFSTGASVYGKKPSAQASEKLYELLQANGLEPLAPPFKAGVDDMHGPLHEGELERAEQFGKELAAKLAGPAG